MGFFRPSIEVIFAVYLLPKHLPLLNDRVKVNALRIEKISSSNSDQPGEILSRGFFTVMMEFLVAIVDRNSFFASLFERRFW